MLSTKDCVRHQHKGYYDRHDAAVREKKLENALLDESIDKFLMSYLPPSTTNTTTLNINKNYINSSSTNISSSTDNTTDIRKNSTGERRRSMSAAITTTTASPRLNIIKRYKKTRKSVTFNSLVQLVMI